MGMQTKPVDADGPDTLAVPIRLANVLRRGGAAGSAGSADPPILDTVGQACVSDPPIFWMVVHFDGTL
jgi:hypothetical protein